MARNVKVAGKVLSIRGLTRKEMRSLKKKGFDIGNLKVEQVDDLLDLIFPMIFDEDEVRLIDDATYKVGNDIWALLLKETFGSKDEEKNLLTSGGGSQTKKE